MTLRRALPCTALLLVACGPSPLPDPRVLSVSPARAVASDVVTLSIDTELVLPFQVDYLSSRATAQPAVTVLLGDHLLDRASYAPGGAITAFVPSGLPPDTYDVSVRLADGRTGTAPAAFTVDPGRWPDSYEFTAPIGDQRVDQPFVVTLRAVLAGATDVGFHGTATLSTNKSDIAVEPATTAPFDAGLVTERSVRILRAGQGVMLQVTDGSGRTVSSNPFRVAD